MEHAENEQNVKRKPNHIGRFIAVTVLTAALAAGWFLLWAYVSYELRLSAEVIRAGLILLYILPCWIGGRVLRRCIPDRAFVWGAVLGVAFYAIFFVLAALDGKTVQITQTHMINGILCVLSGIAGTLRFRRKT